MMMSIIVGLMVILVIILAELLGIHHPGLPINAGANNLTDAQSQGQILGGGSAEEGLKGGGMGVGVGGMFGKGNAVGSEAKLERTSILRFTISNTIVIMTTSYITSLVGALGVATLVTGVILVCYKFSGGKLDPDNVTAPLASTFGDVTTLLLMMGTSTAVSKLFGNGYTSSNGGIGNGFWWKIMGITAVLVTITGIFITIVLLMRILSSTAGTTDAKIGGIGIGIGGVGVGGGIGIGGGGGEYGYDYNILGNENARASTGQEMINGGNVS
ncbi:hypothetical protein AX774_g6886 [Zancudomyces culisetae]|uniref:SLC41A/MgtE integral membrane domain-containing protein n=1 Tax=Zancudomyces culisetae TaxID=1213189 RepID=A0A1R1PFK5_ZANCU|nr:hypothetical protein AX774_g6886 [Zancudomyces culisetae]|eukprot:OMH79693.1 hypothetical protein AX774_g6886 [Zancudomyces culisetae]